MDDTIIVKSFEELSRYLNDDGVLEIAMRGKHKRFKSFKKVILNDLPQKELQAEQAEKLKAAIQKLDENISLNRKNLKLLGEVAKVQKIGLLLNGLNLCATCVGFAIVCNKLEALKEEIGQQINQLKNIVQQGHDIQTDYEFGKVLSLHTDMLDCRRKLQPYSEDKMRDLVDREYNMLSLLIKVFMKDVSGDKQSTIFSIFSMLSMLTVSLRYYDEIYYENNHKALGNDSPWHISHDKWTAVYDTLLSPEFIKKLQDYAAFETDLSTSGIDVFYKGLLDQVVEQQEEIADNQELIVTLGDIDLVHSFREMMDREVRETISDAFAEACEGEPSAELQKILDDTMVQMALA